MKKEFNLLWEMGKEKESDQQIVRLNLKKPWK